MFEHTDQVQMGLGTHSARRKWMWWGAVAGVVLLVIIVLPSAAWIISCHQASQKLAVQVAKVRARGEPLTTIELNEYYKPAAGRPEMTADIVAALALTEAKDLKLLEKDLPIVGSGPEPPPPPQPWPQLEQVEAYLAPQSAALETIREFTRRDGTARLPVDFTTGITTRIPHVQTWRHGAQVLSLQFHVDMHRGRPGDAAECILAQIGLARALDQEPWLISQLVSLAIMAVAMGKTQVLLQHAEIDDVVLARLQEGLRNIEYVTCLKRALAGERAVDYMACIAARALPDEHDLVLKPEEAQELGERPPKRVRDAGMMLETSLRIAEAADQSLTSAWSAGERVDAEVQELGKRVIDRRLYALTLLTSTPFATAVTAFVRSAARRGCADAALAAERYRRRHGQWPENLEQLVPEYLRAVPVDPFNEQPLKMVVTAEEVKIYSVGRDREDNGGNLSIREEPHTDMGFVIPTHRGETPPSLP